MDLDEIIDLLHKEDKRIRLSVYRKEAIYSSSIYLEDITK